MPQAEQPSPPVRLSVRGIVWAMFVLPWRNRGEFLRVLSLPLLALTCCSFAFNLVQVKGSHGLVFPLLGIFVLAFSWLAVKCHRLVLTEDNAAPIRILMTFFAALVVLYWVYLVFTMLVTLPFMGGVRYVPTVSGEPAMPPEFVVPTWWLSTLLSLPGLYLFSRLSLMFPAIAVGRAWNVREAWRLSRGNGIRLLVIVMLVPSLLSGALDFFNRDGISALEYVLLLAVANLLLALEVVALSLAYRELTANPPTPPPAPEGG